MSAEDFETLAKNKQSDPPVRHDGPADDGAPPEKKKTGKPEEVVRLDNVFKGFGSGSRRVQPMNGISLSIAKGQTLGVIGPSGTGKSVMLRLMLGLLDPDEGEVYVFGKNMRELSVDELRNIRARMGMLFQGGALFDSMTVGENVAFPIRAMGEKDEEKIRSTVTEKLRQVGLPDTEDKLPSELSGGMKKRAALARSIAYHPEVIMYDEPTTGLDPIMSDAIANLIRETHDSFKDDHVTSIVVTHDMHVATRVADRIVMLYGGKVVGDGPPDQFRRLGGGEEDPNWNESDRMIRQFVRGEASGPIKTVD